RREWGRDVGLGPSPLPPTLPLRWTGDEVIDMTTSLHTNAHHSRAAAWSTPRKVGAAAAAGGVLAALLAARRVQQGWGATAEEVDAVLAGDELLGPADL